MYCPKCGQSQFSGEAQFCNRCGLSLNIVKELVLSEAIAVKTYNVEGQGIRRFQRQKGMRFGAKLVFWGLAFVLPMLLFSVITNTPFFLFLSLLVVLAGICRMLYARIFEDSESPQQVPQFVVMHNPALTNSLDAQTSANSFGASPRSVAPQSVTEHTTKLLDL
jgi:hypothetical protein